MQEGMRLAMNGDSDRAEYYLLKSYELESDAKILSTLGWFYGLHQGKLQDGFRYFRRAIFYDRESGDAYNECGNLLFRANRLQESLKWFHRALRCSKNERKHYALYNLAVVYRRLNRPERSLRYLNLALRFKPDFKQAGDLVMEVKKEIMFRELQDGNLSI